MLAPQVAIVALLSFPINMLGSGPTEITGSEKNTDARRTLARFPVNVGRGFAGVFQQEKLRPFLVGVAATGLSTPLDDDVRDGIAGQNDDAADFADDNLGPIGLGLVTLK